LPRLKFEVSTISDSLIIGFEDAETCEDWYRVIGLCMH